MTPLGLGALKAVRVGRVWHRDPGQRDPSTVTRAQMRYGAPT